MGLSIENTTKYLENLQAKTRGWEYGSRGLSNAFAFENAEPFNPLFYRSDHWQVASGVGALYLLVIFSLQAFMRNRKALELKGLLFLWNLALSIFSVMGFVRTLPGFLFALSVQDGFYETICLRKHFDLQTLFWSFLFVFSKFWELGDTLFIVLRKRPLIKLQWYHHLTTMIYAWAVSLPLMEPIERWHLVFNFGIHSLVYPYFTLRSAGIKVPAFAVNIITTMQFAQMVTLLSVNGASIYFKNAGHACLRQPINTAAAFWMFGSFMILFGKLFVDSVIKRGRARRAKND